MPKGISIKTYPPTARAGVLCIDGGGTRGVLPLKNMKRIEDRIKDRIGLRIPL
jgi:patatin-like phospholipase/acyl hydrolase